MDLWYSLREWDNADVQQRVVLSFMLAAVWTTMAVGVVRLRWRAGADKLAILWLMSTFGFTLMNLVVLLGALRWPVNAIVDAAALVLVPVAYFEYGMHIKISKHEGRRDA